MLRRLFAIFCSFWFVVPTADGHTLTWEGVEFDYAELTKGEDCCSDVHEECRPAYSYHPEGNDFVLEFPKDPRDPNTTHETVRVPRENVKWINLKNAGFAHACVSYDGSSKTWSPYCIFIPPGRITMTDPGRRDSEALLIGAPPNFRLIY